MQGAGLKENCSASLLRYSKQFKIKQKQKKQLKKRLKYLGTPQFDGLEDIPAVSWKWTISKHKYVINELYLVSL